jgi:hypothetical protein
LLLTRYVPIINKLSALLFGTAVAFAVAVVVGGYVVVDDRAVDAANAIAVDVNQVSHHGAVAVVDASA